MKKKAFADRFAPAWALGLGLVAFAAPRAAAQVPASAITGPTSAFLNSLPSISGTAQAYAGASVSSVDVSMQDLSSGFYWNGSSFSSVAQSFGSATFVGSSSGTWTYSAGGLTLTNGTSYQIKSQATDSASQIQTSTSVLSFVFDNQPPVTSIVNPSNGAFLSSIPSVNGTGFDNVLLSTVQLSLQDVASGDCYNPVNNTFNLGCPAWFGAQGSTTAWSFAFATQPWTQAHSYILLSSGTDAAQNAQTALSASAFTYDVSAPTVTVSVPGAFLNPTQATFVGTSTDSPAGLSSVQLALSSGAGLGNWLGSVGGTFNQPVPVYFTTTTYVIGSPDNWTWAPDTAALTDGQNYLLRTQATDKAANVRTQNFSFLYDATPAVASVTFPANGSFADGSLMISGGSYDVPGPGGFASGVSTVAVSIMSTANGKCYIAGAGFTSTLCPNFIPATGGAPAAWTFTPTPNPFTTGVSYVILAQGTDNAGNVQSVFSAAVSSITFTYDTGVPSVYFQMPTTAGREINLTTLSGTATDSIPNDLAMVQIRVQDTNDLNMYADPGNLTFDLSAAQAEAAWFDATTASTPSWTSWSLSSGIVYTSGHLYNLEARTLNQANGYYAASYSTQAVVYDNMPPFTSTLLPAVGSAVSSLPMLSGAAIDQTGTGQNLGTLTDVRVRLTRLSDGSYWNGTIWQVSSAQLNAGTGVQIYNSTNTWELSTNLPPSTNNSSTGLTDGTSYYITTSGIDNANPGGNVEAFNTPARASTFTAALIGPSMGFTAPVNGSSVASLGQIQGTANAPVAGISYSTEIFVSIQENGPGFGCWNGLVTGGTFTLTGCPIYYPISGAGIGGTFANPNWSMNMPPLTNLYGYKVLVKGEDNATPVGNFTPNASIPALTFSYNTSLPSIAITYPPALPATGGNLSAAFTVSGTASDNFGVAYTSVAYQEASSNAYWNPATSTFSSLTPIYIGASFSGSAPNFTFTQAAPTPAATTGRDYNIYAYVQNTAGLSQTAAPVTILWDTTPPTSAVVAPASGTYVNALSAVTGTASDPGALGSGVAGTQLQIMRDSDDTCWNGTAWASVCLTNTGWMTAAAGTAWAVTSNLPPVNNLSSGFQNGMTYTLTSRAFDVAANTQTALTSNLFTVDLTTPTVSISSPAAGSSGPNFPPISGTAADPISGIVSVGVQISSAPGFNTCWSGSAWGGCPDFLIAGGTAAWSLSGSLINSSVMPGTTYQILAQATDLAGNVQIALSSFTYTGTGGNCAVSTYVVAGVNTIQGAVNAVGSSLSGNYCVFLGSGTYNEQVTIQNIATNGFTLTIASTTGTLPAVNPPANSTAAFVIANASVTLYGISVAPTNALTYGVYVSSPNAAIVNSVIADPGGKIGSAAIAASSWTAVANSTVTEGGGGVVGVALYGASGATLINDDILGSPAVYISSSDGASVTTSVLVSSNGGVGLVVGGTGSVTLLSNTFVGGPSTGATGVAVTAFSGAISMFSNVIQGAPIGLGVAAQIGSPVLTVNGLTFSALHPGATAIDFAGGTFVSTFAGVAFNDPNMAVNVNAAALSSGSSVTMAGPSGVKSGASFDVDPNHYVHWPSSGAPTSVITGPPPGFVNSLPGINGLAQAYAGATVSGVAVSVQNLANGFYWNGASSFSSTGPVLNVAPLSPAATAWSYVNAALAASLITGATYQIQSQATDSNSLTQSTGTAVVIVYDTAPPSAFIAAPVNGSSLPSLPAVSGTASDTLSGVSQMWVQISSGPSYGACWNGAAWGTCPNFQAAPGTATWSYAALPPLMPGTTYQIQAIADDYAGNISTAALSSFVYSGVGPSCSVSTVVVAGVNTIQGAVLAAGPSLSGGNYCITVSSGVYPEQVTIQNIATNGFQILIASGAGGAPTVTPPAFSTAAFVIANASVSVSGIDIAPAHPLAYGVYISSTYVRINGVNVQDAGGNIATAGIVTSSWTAVNFTNVMVSGNAAAIWLPGSVMTRVMFSSATASDSAGGSAIWLDAASSNMIAQSYAASGSGNGVLLTNSNYNTINQSVLASSVAANAGLYLTNSASNTITQNSILSQAGYAAYFAGSNSNTISQSTLTTNNSTGYAALFLSGASNLITQSQITNLSGYGAYLNGANGNTITQSLMASDNASGSALYLNAANANMVTQSNISNPAGTGAYLFNNSNSNAVSQSSITSAASGYYALYVRQGSSNTFFSDVVQGSTAVYLSSATGTLIGGSSLVATSAAGYALQMDQGSGGLTLSGSSLSAPAGTGLSLAAGNSGLLLITTDTIMGARYGALIAAQAAGAVLSINSLNFAGLAPGATALEFMGGAFVSTFTMVSFDSSVAVNVDAAALSAGTRITMATPVGPRSGPMFSTDPNHYVHWPSSNPPTSFVSAPAAAYVNSLPNIGGGAQAFAGATVSAVGVSIRNMLTGTYWTGAAFVSSTAVFNAASVIGASTATWTFSTAGLAGVLTNGTSYQIQSQATDSYGQTQIGSASSSFLFDNAPPSVFIQLPIQNAVYAALPSISGTSADPFLAVATVTLSVQQIGGSCFSPVTQNFAAACPSPFPAKGIPPAWSFPGIPWISSHQYTVAATAAGLAGNVQSSTASFTILVSTGLGTGAPGDGQGAATLLPASITGCQLVAATATFTAGPAGIAAGGAIAFHIPSGWTQPQGSTSSAPGYVSIVSTGGYNLEFNPPQVGGANLGPGWVVYVATAPVTAGQPVEFIYSGYPGQGAAGPQVFSFDSQGSGSGVMTGVPGSPSLNVGPGAPALLSFAPSGAMTLGAFQNSPPMQIQLLDACGVAAVQPSVPLSVNLSANAGGATDASAVFYSTPGGFPIAAVSVAVGAGVSSPFYFNTSTAGVTLENLQANATLSGTPTAVSRSVNLLPAPAAINGASVDTGTPGTALNATISAGGAGAQSVYINFTLSNPALTWEVIIASVSGAFSPKVADFTGTGNPGRTLVWNGSDLLASPAPFLPPGTYYVQILAGGGSAVNTALTITIAPSASVYGVLTNGPGATVSAIGPNAGPGNFAVASSTGYFQIRGLQNGSVYLIQASSSVQVSSAVLTVLASTSAVATTAGTNVGSLTFTPPSQLDVSATLPFAAPADMFASVSVHNSSFTQTGSGSLHFAAGATASDNGAQSFGLTASTLTVIPIPPGVYEVDVALPALGISTSIFGVVVNGASPTFLPISLQKQVNVYGYAILPSTVSANTFVSVQAQSATPGVAAVLGGVTVPVASSSAIYALFGLSAGTWTVTAVSQGALPASSTVSIAGASDIGTATGGGLNLALKAAGSLNGTLTVAGNTSQANLSASCPNGAALCVPVTVYSPTSFYTGSVTVVLATSTTQTSSAFSLAGLPDGLYFVSAQLNGYVSAGQNVNVVGGAGTASLSLTPTTSLLFVTVDLPGGPRLPSDFEAVSLGLAGTHGETLSYADMTAGTTVQYFASSATLTLASLNVDAYQLQAFCSTNGMYKTATASVGAGANSSVLLDLSGSTYAVSGTLTLGANLSLPNSAGQSVVVSSVPGLVANTGSLNYCLLGYANPPSISAAHLELLPAGSAGAFASGPLQTSGCSTGANLISPLNAAGTGPQLPNPYLAYAATIAANGAFSFPNVPPGVYQLRNNAVIDAAGDAIPQFSQTVVVTGTVAGLAFQLGSGVAVSGSVLAPTGSVLTRSMTVNLANASGAITSSATVSFNGSASASFSFPQVAAGNYTLLLQDSSYPKAYAAAPLPVLVAGTGLSAQNLQALQSGTIKGHIAIQENLNGARQFMLISATNLGLLPASFQIQALSALGAIGYASGPNGGTTPVLDVNGEYTVDGLPPGTYSVLFTAPGTAGAVALINASVPGVVVQGGSVNDIGTTNLAVGAQLSGRITDATSGLALANVPVEALPSQRGSGVSSQPLQTLTDGNGRYVLNGLDPTVRYYDVYAAYRGNEQQGETLPPYQQTISPAVDITTISAMNFSVAPALSAVGGRIAAPAGGSPLGVPLLANGLSLPGALVYLQKSGVTPLRNPIADIQFQTDINGNFTIPSLTTGTYVLTAASLGYAPFTQLVSVVSASANAGVLTMAQAGTLSGTLTDADGSYPSVNSVSQILAATSDLSSILTGALTTNPNTQTVTGYSISGFKPGLSYHVMIVDSQNGIVSPPEASSVVLTSTASATINITYRPGQPLVVASASRQAPGFQLSFVLSQPLRNLTAADNAFSSILTTVSAQGSLSQFALSQDRTILTAYYLPGVSESSFTLRCSGYTTLVNPASTDPVNNEFLIASTVTFYTGIDGLGQTNVANLNGGDVLVAGDNGRVTLPPGSFNVTVSSAVLITLQVAEEPLTAVSAASVGGAPAARLQSLRYGANAYPSEILAAAAAVPPTVNPLSAFYNIFLPLGVSTALSKPAQLTLAYSSGTDPTTLNLYWYNPAANAYVLTQDVTGAPPVINIANRTITLNVNHFSTYVLFNSAQAVITGGTGAGALTADNFPNPFDLGAKLVTPLHASGACSPSCTINGTMIGVSVPPSLSGDATIRIFNIAGARVRTIGLGSVTGGTFYYQNWDGTNDSGAAVASGVYIGELKIGGRSVFFKMAIIKGSGL